MPLLHVKVTKPHPHKSKKKLIKITSGPARGLWLKYDGHMARVKGRPPYFFATKPKRKGQKFVASPRVDLVSGHSLMEVHKPVAKYVPLNRLKKQSKARKSSKASSAARKAWKTRNRKKGKRKRRS